VTEDESRQRVLQHFLAGATYQQIAAAVELDTGQVHDIVCAELKQSGDRRGVLVENFTAVFQERAEALFKAHWAPALRGDHKSAEICRRILEQQHRIISADSEKAAVQEKSDDELAKFRARRAAP